MSETSYNSSDETTYQSENYLTENTAYLSDEYSEDESTYNSLRYENTTEEEVEDNSEEDGEENAEKDGENNGEDYESVYCSDGDDYDGLITDEDTEDEEELKEIRERMITRMRLKNDPNTLVGFVEAQIEKNDSEMEKNIQN